MLTNSTSLSISKSNILVGKNKLKIERIKDASKKVYSDFSSIFNVKLSRSKKFYVNSACI